MRIEHVALWTLDLERLKNFYEKYFNGRSGTKYTNHAKGFESYFLSFESGGRLEIMTVTSDLTAPQEGRGPLTIGYSHLAFATGSQEHVDQLTERLRRDGYPVVSESRFTGDGYYESCILDPDGNRVEITI
jgi:lactoylglutathione lyase